MANTLRFKRGLVSGIPTAALGEPLFTTDTFDLYIGNGTGNTRFQKYIASGTTSQLLRGDGSLYTFPLNISSPSNGQVLKYDGTNWVNSADAGVTGSGAAGQVTYWGSSSTITGSNNLFWDATNNRLGIGTNVPSFKAHVKGGNASTLKLDNDGSRYVQQIFEINTAANSGADFLLDSTSGTFNIRTLAAYPMIFQTAQTAGGPLERARITSTGNFIINNASTDNGLRFQVTGDGYFSGSVGIGTTSLTGFSLLINQALTTGTALAATSVRSTIQSNATLEWNSYQSLVGTQAASFTLTNLRHFAAQQSSLGAGSSVSNQFGFIAASSLTGATNNYGFYGDIASATGRWNLYMNGTANNYMAGSLGIGTTALTGVNLYVLKPLTGSTQAVNVFSRGTIQSDVTQVASYFRTFAGTQATAFTLSILRHFSAEQTAIGAGSAVSDQMGYYVDSTLIGATNNFGFYGNIASGTGRWNLYMNGTAANYLNGQLLIGTTTISSFPLDVNGAIRSSGLITAATEFRINNQSFTRIAIGDTNGAIAGGYNFKLTSNVPQHDSTGAISGYYYHNSGYIGWFTGTSQAANTNATERMRLDASGNLGLGVTPSAWAASQRVMQINNASLGGTTSNVALAYNTFFNGTNSIYINNGFASYFNQTSGQHQWFTAASGTAGGTITWSQPMTLFATGNLAIGTTTDAGFRLDVNGTMRVSGATTITGSLGSVQVLASGAELYFTRNANNDLYANGGSSAAISIAAQSHVRFLTGTTLTERARFDTTGNFSVDSGVLYVDAVNNRVGINDINPDYALDVTGEARVTNAIAIGTTPDTNKPFKILKNINGTVGINFENTSTGSLAFSAIQMGTDVSGGTKFTNIVYSSSGVAQSGVYYPDGTSIINIGTGGLNFYSQGAPIRMFNGGGNGVLKWEMVNDSFINHYTGTAPTTSATDGYRQYSADVTAGNAAPHFRTENGAIIKLYQETTGVGNAIFSQGGGNSVLDDSTFDGYTLRQIVKALRNQGILA